MSQSCPLGTPHGTGQLNTHLGIISPMSLLLSGLFTVTFPPHPQAPRRASFLPPHGPTWLHSVYNQCPGPPGDIRSRAWFLMRGVSDCRHAAALCKDFSRKEKRSSAERTRGLLLGPAEAGVAVAPAWGWLLSKRPLASSSVGSKGLKGRNRGKPRPL